MTVSTLSRDAWIDDRIAAIGAWLQARAGTIRAVQWALVAVYVVLVAVPAFLPLPERSAHLWNDLTLFAQFGFWGIWWPFVLVSMVLVGRGWCGILCPEGTLTEFASRWSLGRAVPRWLTWTGWPFIAFAGTTIYGQMVSVCGYPKPVLAVLGGSTVAAIAVGLLAEGSIPGRVLHALVGYTDRPSVPQGLVYLGVIALMLGLMKWSSAGKTRAVRPA